VNLGYCLQNILSPHRARQLNHTERASTETYCDNSCANERHTVL